MNLLKETRGMLRNKIKEIEWIGSEDGEYAISWKQFVKIADVEYDNGYGAQEIASDLIIVGKDWWMSRYEYDGSEGWEWHEKPIKKDKPKKFNKVKGGMWENIRSLNKEVKQ